MMITVEDKPMPEERCTECGTIGKLVMKGVDADNGDAPVVKCSECGKLYTLKK